MTMVEPAVAEIAERLTEAQRRELARFDPERHNSRHGHWRKAGNPVVAGLLARKGLLGQAQQEERPLHGPTVRYFLYTLTPLGLALRAHLEGTRP